MNYKILTVLFPLFFFPSSSFGEMHKWVDSNGVKHWTNTAPPESAEHIISSGEVAYSAPAPEYRNQEVVVSSVQYEPLPDDIEMIDNIGSSGINTGYSQDDDTEDLSDNSYHSSIPNRHRVRIDPETGNTLIPVTSGYVNSQDGTFSTRHGSINRDQRKPINVPETGEILNPAAGGYTGTRDGSFYQNVAGGMIDTKTGKFIPKR